MNTSTLPSIDFTPLFWSYSTVSVRTASGSTWTIVNRPSGTVAVRYSTDGEPWCRAHVTVTVDGENRLVVTDDRGRLVARSTSIISVYVLEN